MRKKLTILVVDQDNIAYHILQSCFKRHGEEANWMYANNQRQALAYLIDHAPDIIFIDPYLPDTKDLAVLEILRHAGWFEKSRICLLCALTAKQLKSYAEGFAFYTRLPKPFKISYLQYFLSEASGM